MSHETDIAWAAGIVEGEGCITLATRNGTPTVRLQVGMTDRDILERLAGIMGCGSVVVQQRRLPEGYKVQYRWVITASKAEECIDLILPWLGARRTARYAEVLQRRRAYEEFVMRTRRCRFCGEAFRPRKWSQSARFTVYCSRECGRNSLNEQRRDARTIAAAAKRLSAHQLSIGVAP